MAPVLLNTEYVVAGDSPRFKTQCLLFKLSLVSHFIYCVNVFLLTSIYFFPGQNKFSGTMLDLWENITRPASSGRSRNHLDVISRNDCTQNKTVHALGPKKGFQFGANVKECVFCEIRVEAEEKN